MSYHGVGSWRGARVLSAITLLSLITPAAFGQDKPEKKGYLDLVFGQRKKAEMTKAMMNAKQLFLLMVEFDQDFGAFPNDETAEADQDLNGYQGKFSNDYLGQLIAGGYTHSEEIFYAKGGSSTDQKPDNQFRTKAQTLAAGECGFAYVKGQSVSNNTGRPLLCAPMTGKGVKFDPKPYSGKAVVLRIDGSVKTYTINKDGEVILPNGKGLFENGAGTVWGENGFKKEMLVFPK